MGIFAPPPAHPCPRPRSISLPAPAARRRAPRTPNGPCRCLKQGELHRTGRRRRHTEAQITLTEELFARLAVGNDPTASKQIARRRAYLLKKKIPYKYIHAAIRAAVANNID